jgi:large repetitive protein
MDAAGVVTALAAGTVRLTATSEGKFGSATVVVLSDPDPITVGTENLPEAIEGRGYAHQLEAVGGSGEHSWVLAAGSLPSGLTLSPAGIISGTPVGWGTSDFRVRVTDSGSRTATAELSIVVVRALAVQTSSLPDAVLGQEYATSLAAVGGRGALTWTLIGGDAPWLTFSPTGVLSGTPEAQGASTITVEVADESGQEATRQLSIVVRAPLAVAAITLPTATQGRAYAQQLVATGGDGAYSWTLESGVLPVGVVLTTGGALTGTPTESGDHAFTVQVMDGAGRVATRSLTLTVEPAPTIQSSSLPFGDVGTPYAAQLQATGGTGAYTWSVTQGALPDGLSLSPAGAITGTPTAVGSSSFTVQVTDEAAATDSRAFTLVIAQVEALSSGVAVNGIAGIEGSARYYVIAVPQGATGLIVSISGGTGDVDLYVRHGALPQSFAYDCRPFRPGNEETCTFTPPAAGSWYVMLRGYVDYTGVTLVATYEE